MGGEAEAEAGAPSPPPSSSSWHAYISEDLSRNVKESAGTAIRSARSFGQSSSTHLQSLQEFVPEIGSRYKYYEEAFFHKVKDVLLDVREQPALVGGVAVASLFLMRGPRRFLFRQTLGRFQSEEARFVRAEKNVKDLSISVDVMKNESRKLLERSVLAEKDMKRGHSGLRDAGTQIQSLSRSFLKAETAATDLMNLLREIPGREAIKLRADVASMASHLQQQRSAMDKRILKISNFAKRLVSTAIEEAAKKREVRYNDIKKIEKGIRRHFHDDITVIVMYLDHKKPLSDHTHKPGAVNYITPPVDIFSYNADEVVEDATDKIFTK